MRKGRWREDPDRDRDRAPPWAHCGFLLIFNTEEREREERESVLIICYRQQSCRFNHDLIFKFSVQTAALCLCSSLNFFIDCSKWVADRFPLKTFSVYEVLLQTWWSICWSFARWFFKLEREAVKCYPCTKCRSVSVFDIPSVLRNQLMGIQSSWPTRSSPRHRL